MSAHRKRRYASAPARQRGQAFLLVVLLLVVGIGALIFSLASRSKVDRERDRITAEALAQAKQALIGWSASRTPTGLSPNARPGELPCPDIDDTGNDPGGCSAGAIGRVPWRTLGIPELKDGAGETLWYAIAGPFRYYHPTNSPGPITSDTLGNLTVNISSSPTPITLTTQAIAVIFAPGAVVGVQNRAPSSTAPCATTGTTIARKLCAANYLESTGGGNNAQINGPFIQAQFSNTFNDRLLVITNADLMPAVEQRVAREMISYLNSYRATTGVYPWADVLNGDSNGDVEELDAYNRARFPCGTALPYDWGRSSSPATPSLPAWLKNGCGVNGWASIIYFAIAKNRLEDSGSGCGTCSGSTLTVNNASGRIATQCSTASPPTCTSQVVSSGSADLVLITPGAATMNPRGNWPASTSPWMPITGYFEDAENSDNNNDTFVVPVSTSYDRDRIYFVR